MNQDPPEPVQDRIGSGVSVALGLVFLAEVILLLVAVVVSFPKSILDGPGWLFVMVWSPGWTQLLYLPIYILMQYRRGYPKRAGGALLVALVLLLLTTACNSMMNTGPLLI